MSEGPTSLTDKQMHLLKILFSRSKSLRIFTTYLTQSQLAKELGITRQALNVHLRKLKEEGYIRTGRGFIDLTDKALRALGVRTADAFVMLRIEPKARSKAYEKLAQLPVERIYRVTGDIDIIAEINQAYLDEFLKEISQIDGVEETRTYIVIELLK